MTSNHLLTQNRFQRQLNRQNFLNDLKWFIDVDNLHLSYSEHALARMYDRGIFKKQVRRALRRPDEHYTQGAFQVTEYTTTSGALIRVIFLFIPGTEAPLIVSAVRLGKLPKAHQRIPAGTHCDSSHDLAYVAVSQGKLATSIEIASGIYYDLDAGGTVMGVEVFDFSCYNQSDPKHILKRLPF